jgi:hypothetical protein
LYTLPSVHEIFWERVARDFENVGPEACMAEIVDELLAQNPHYLEIAIRSACDSGAPERVLTGFAMFYRILALGARDRGGALPRITLETRDAIAALVSELGEAQFTSLATDTLRDENPCMMQMADSFASRFPNYLLVMQGFVLLYRMLSAQAVIDGLRGVAFRRADPPADPFSPKE